MPKKAIKTTKKSKDIKQKQNQTQKQTVNVNINQTKTTKKTKTSRKKNNLPQTPVIYNYGQSSVGNPSDNLLYNRPPVIAQVIPAMGGDTNALMPPSNTSIETILKAMKEKTDRIMRPSKKLTDSGTQDIFNMEPKKKFEYKPETLTTIAPKGIKIQVPKQPPFKLTGEIVQRKNTDMQTEPQINIPKRKQLIDTGSNEIFNKPSETADYKAILNASNQEMTKLINRVEKLATKKPKEKEPPKRKQLTDTGVDIFYNKVPKFKSVSHGGTQTETQTMPQNIIKSVSHGETQTENKIKHGGPQTEIFKPKKLIFNQKKIEKRKQILKYKDFVPANLLTIQGQKKISSYLVPQTISEKAQIISEKAQKEKDELKKKAHSILAGVQTNIPAFKYLAPPQKSSLTRVKKKQPLNINEKSLANITDINVSKSKDALKHFTKINNMFKDATKSDKNMNDILQGLQMQNKIPDFLKKDTGGILETPQKQEKASNKIKSFIKDSLERKKENKKQEIASVKPVELFGGTRSGTIIHPEATAPPQPLYGKPIEKSIHDNFEKIRKIYDTPPKSYKEVLDAKVEINKYKQQINRIKIRNAKSVLSSEQIAFKKETLIEIKKLQKTYDKIYKDFYKDQQPKKGRPKKSKA